MKHTIELIDNHLIVRGEDDTRVLNIDKDWLTELIQIVTGTTYNKHALDGMRYVLEWAGHKHDHPVTNLFYDFIFNDSNNRIAWTS